MGSTPPSSPGAVVIDANVAIAVAAKETGKEAVAKTELRTYSALGYQFYAPGVLVTETLYILCQQLNAGLLTTLEHTQAVQDFELFMRQVLAPPNGDSALINRAEQIRDGYGCSRSSDGIYIALAEDLAKTVTTYLITFDRGIVNQAASKAPSVYVCLLTP